jgi:hypothetical protein
VLPAPGQGTRDGRYARVRSVRVECGQQPAVHSVDPCVQVIKSAVHVVTLSVHAVAIVKVVHAIPLF